MDQPAAGSGWRLPCKVAIADDVLVVSDQDGVGGERLVRSGRVEHDEWHAGLLSTVEGVATPHPTGLADGRPVVPRVIQESIRETPAYWTDWAALNGLRRGQNRTSEHWSTPADRKKSSHNP